jgi:microcystin-dependent protein
VPFIGEIRAFASELPAGWLPCDGRHLEIEQHVALFSLLRTAYGGDGKKTFALPDLRGRATAGVDVKLRQLLGASSGLERHNASLIPFAVTRWGIATFGAYPEPS